MILSIFRNTNMLGIVRFLAISNVALLGTTWAPSPFQSERTKAYLDDPVLDFDADPTLLGHMWPRQLVIY